MKNGEEHFWSKANIGRDDECWEWAAGKLTEASVLEIRRLWAMTSLTQRTLGEMFSVDQSLISCIVHRKIWRHLEAQQ